MDGQAVAVLDTLNAKNYEKWWTPEWTDAVNKGLIVKRDLDGGQMSRDMTLYVDEDGKAYHIYSSEENLTLQIAELSDDYLSHTGNYVRVAPAGHNEAPAIFKKDGTYWMITSGCTGWAPNEARMFSSSSIFGPGLSILTLCGTEVGTYVRWTEHLYSEGGGEERCFYIYGRYLASGASQ